MWNHLPVTTPCQEYGFDILQRITAGRDFVYDFLRCPTHSLIDRIMQEHVPTTATISLTARSLGLQVPPLPNALFAAYELVYELRSAGDDYSVAYPQVWHIVPGCRSCLVRGCCTAHALRLGCAAGTLRGCRAGRYGRNDAYSTDV
jgi:hypothetical protein